MEATTPSHRNLRWLGRYALVEKLAEGGMGSVHAALHANARQLCVLKQLRRGLAQEEIAVRRFYREASIGALLVHPRIAQVYGAGTEDGIFCISMELVQGVDLDAMHMRMIATHQLLPPALVFHLALGALEGLSYAHAATHPDGTPIGVVHRDITPRNLMLAFDGETKIIDFGLARGTGDDLRTRPGAFLGTPRYASPEQAQGERIDHRSDLYSLSVVLFECLTGRPLVPPGSMVQMLDDVSSVDAPALDAINPRISPEVAKVIARGLRKKPAERWPDATAYASALGAALDQEETTDGLMVAAFMRETFTAEAERLRSLLKKGQRLIGDLSSSPDDSSFMTLEASERSMRSFSGEEDGTTSFREFTATQPTPSFALDLVPTRASGRIESLLTPVVLPQKGGAKPVRRRQRRIPPTVMAASIAAVAASTLTVLFMQLLGGQPPAPLAPPVIGAVQEMVALDPVPSASAALSAAPSVSTRPTAPAEPPKPVSPPRARPRPPDPPASPPPPAPAPPAVGPLKTQLASVLGAPTPENRARLREALEQHPRRSAIAMQLSLLKMSPGQQRELQLLRDAVGKLEP